MSAWHKVGFGVSAAGIACFLAAMVVAQERAGQTGQRQDTAGRGDAGQTDRFDTQQPGQSATRQQGRATTQQYGQTQRGAQAGGAQQDVERFLASCLLAKNQAEIELSQFAQQQSQNPQVKQFAQQMVQDHQQLQQQLQQLAGGAAAGRTGARTGTDRLETTSQFETQERDATDRTRLPGSPGAGQATTRTETNTTIAAGETARGAAGQSGSQAIEQLIQIERQIVERCTQMTRDELQQKQGAEFDQAFVGAAIPAHMGMLAALQTIQQQVPGRLAQVAQEAQPVVEQHLEHAKQLKQQMAGQTGTQQRAQRETPRTQR